MGEKAARREKEEESECERKRKRAGGMAGEGVMKRERGTGSEEAGARDSEQG